MNSKDGGNNAGGFFDIQIPNGRKSHKRSQNDPDSDNDNRNDRGLPMVAHGLWDKIASKCRLPLVSGTLDGKQNKKGEKE